MFGQPVHDRGQMERRFANPARQCGTMQIETRAVLSTAE